MPSYLYSYGLPFSEILAVNIGDLLQRIKDKKASMVIIDGGVGEGKTTLAVHLADYINKENGLEPISLAIKEHPQIALGGKEFLTNLRECYEKELPVLIYDEAGDFNRRGSLTRFNAMLNRSFETYRGFKILVILCLPSVKSLDEELFLKNIPRLLLHLDNRSIEYGNFSGYGLYRAMYVKDKMSKLVVKSFAYNFVTPNFRGHFLDLMPERSRQLDKLSTAGKLEVLRKSEILIEGLLSYKDLATKLNRSIIWTRAAALKHKIKPVKIIHRAKYFDEGALNRLADIMDGLT